MSRKQFISEQALYFMQFPDSDHLQFYKWYTKHHPDDDLGWFSLAEEMENLGHVKEAIACYKRCAQLNKEYATPARMALERLDSIPQKKKGKRKILLTFLFSTILFISFLVLPSDIFAPNRTPDSYQSVLESFSYGMVEDEEANEAHYTWIEVVKIDHLEDPKLEQKLFSYWKSREDELKNPVALIVVQDPLLQAWTPQLFVQPDQMVGMLIRDAYATPRWIEKDCQCRLPKLGEASKISDLLTARYQEQRKAMEEWLVLRSALYHYRRLNGELPVQLSQLTQPFPYNYLSDFPLISSSLPSRYLPELIDERDVWPSLERVIPFEINGKRVKVPYAFGPLTININKEELKLTVHSGRYWIRQYPVGLGKEDRTPAGRFSISKKVNQPVSSTNVYGTRGLVLSDERYAIHGTNNPNSIGQYQSHGCIRLNNPDVEDLYAIIPIGTEVNIRNTGQLAGFRNPSGGAAPVARDNEHDATPYQWLW